MDWAVIAGIFTILSVNLATFFYLGNKIDSLRNDIHAEMKDFHGRLCSLEARYHQQEIKPKTNP